jgi:hypothetical protein
LLRRRDCPGHRALEAALARCTFDTQPVGDAAVASQQRIADARQSRWAFLLTFAGVGLKTNFAELRRHQDDSPAL